MVSVVLMALVMLVKASVLVVVGSLRHVGDVDG